MLSRPASGAELLSFSELYKSYGVLGLEFSDRVRALTGSAVVMRGFMAPPLRAESDFFVLTREPLALCPFCASDAEWPSDILVVYLRARAEAVPVTRPIEVSGRLEAGSWTDPATGFVSQLRLRDAGFEIV